MITNGEQSNKAEKWHYIALKIVVQLMDLITL